MVSAMVTTIPSCPPNPLSQLFTERLSDFRVLGTPGYGAIIIPHVSVRE